MLDRHRLKTRFLALFVTVFVCLNGAGAACVAYCQTMDKPEEAADHCPLKKLGKHSGADEAFASVKSGEFRFCPMSVSFFAAPVEKPSLSLKQPGNVPVIRLQVHRTEFRNIPHLLSVASYRGPPPLDRRVDRIKHRVLLI